MTKSEAQRPGVPAAQRFRLIYVSLRPRSGPPAWALLICAVMLVSGLFLASTPVSTSKAFALGSIGRNVAFRFQGAETTAAGQSFRWTDGDSTLLLPPQGIGAHLLRLTIAAPRPSEESVPTTLAINGHPALAFAQSASPRRYSLLVPPDWLRMTSNAVRIQSATFQPPQDSQNRTLGVAVFDAGWSSLNKAPWLVLAQILVIGLASGLLYLLLVAAGIGIWPRLLAVGLFVAISLAMRHGDSRFVYRWNAIIVTAASGLMLAVALALLRRQRPAATILSPGSWARRHWPALAGYLVVTGVMLLPLLSHLTTQIIGPPGDNYEYLWKMQWFSDALLGQHVSPVFAPQIFYPAGPDLTISEITPANTLLALPITRLFGPIVSYNLVIIASFVLTGFFTYLLAQRLGATRGAAWVAGIIFAFCLRRFFHSTGHLGMMGTQWLALTLYGWEGVLTRRRMWDGYVAGLGLALITWSSWLYGTTFPVLIAAYTLVRLGIRGLPQLRAAWPALLLAVAVAIALVLPLAQPYFEARLQGETYQHRYGQVLANAARPLEYLWPNPYHPLWGNWARQFYPAEGERGVAPGYVALVLGIMAIWLGRRRPVVQGLAAVVLISVVLSFGPELQLPSGARLPLPTRFIYDHVPVVGNIRTWGRMAIYAALALGLLAGLALTAAPQRWHRAAWVRAAGLVLAETASIMPLSTPQPRPVDLWLGRQPGAGAVAEVPNGVGALSIYYTLFTGKPTNLGQGKFTPSLWREGGDLLSDFPKESAIRLLQRWGTEYIIVDEADMTSQITNWRVRAASQPLLSEVYRADGYSVYRLQR